MHHCLEALLYSTCPCAKVLAAKRDMEAALSSLAQRARDLQTGAEDARVSIDAVRAAHDSQRLHPTLPCATR